MGHGAALKIISISRSAFRVLASLALLKLQMVSAFMSFLFCRHFIMFAYIWLLNEFVNVISKKNILSFHCGVFVFFVFLLSDDRMSFE